MYARAIKWGICQKYKAAGRSNAFREISPAAAAHLKTKPHKKIWGAEETMHTRLDYTEWNKVKKKEGMTYNWWTLLLPLV